MKVTKLSGFPEYLPAERIVEQHFLDVIRETFELHGFSSMETRAVEPVERLIERGIFDRQIAGGAFVHRQCDAVAVHRSGREGSEQEQIERALHQGQRCHRHVSPLRRCGEKKVWCSCLWRS